MRCSDTEEMTMTQLASNTKIELVWLSGACWRRHHSLIPIPTTYYHPKSPHLTVIDLPPRGCNALPLYWTLLSLLSSFLSPPCLPPAPATPPALWHHQLWQETKSVSDHRRLASKGRPWQLSINLPRLFFFSLLPFFNLRQQTLESCCQHNGGILAGLAPPGPTAPRPVPSL